MIILDVVQDLLLSPTVEILADVKAKLAEARSLDGLLGHCPMQELSNQLSKTLPVPVIQKVCNSW